MYFVMYSKIVFRKFYYYVVNLVQILMKIHLVTEYQWFLWNWINIEAKYRTFWAWIYVGQVQMNRAQEKNWIFGWMLIEQGIQLAYCVVNKYIKIGTTFFKLAKNKSAEHLLQLWMTKKWTQFAIFFSPSITNWLPSALFFLQEIATTDWEKCLA